MHERSGPQFFRANTRKKKKKKPDAFDEQRFVMIFYTNLGVAVILRSFGLVPEGKAGKEIQARI